ncbi:Uncharacterised protein [Moraxella caprae]|uniref:Uncharacterized protein n=1 Tax=Moraxella caprae TaxID=90240 RepID=A0A378QL16_9GAMM|nr:hypothetical protein [Moraxella caprae]STZ01566.1 Uncharacterised protein [Moraxella caprae]
MKVLILLACMFMGIGMPVSLYYSTPSLGLLPCLAFGILSFVGFSLVGLILARNME